MKSASHPIWGEEDEWLLGLKAAWGNVPWLFLGEKAKDEILVLEVQFADGNPESSPDPLTHAQFNYKRGRRRKAEWAAEVYRLTQTSVVVTRTGPEGSAAE